jgi:hypothetical protein
VLGKPSRLNHWACLTTTSQDSGDNYNFQAFFGKKSL